MKKLFLIILSLFLFNLNVYARNLNKGIISVINESKIPASSIAISVKDLNTGKTVYKINDKILMHPASIQKVLTMVPVMEELGDDYQFRTELYSRGKDGYLFKLGADPYLTSENLNTLIENINATSIKKLYIDDSIIEPKDWGEGWQWDDDLNEYTPRFNAYNLDSNLVKITIVPTIEGQNAQIIKLTKSPYLYINNVKTGQNTNITIERNNVTASNIVNLDGTVNSAVTETIPINNLKQYFNYKLKNNLEDKNIYLKDAYIIAKQNNNDKKIAEITHSAEFAVIDVLQNSNNAAAETLAKVAGGKKYKKQGTDLDGIKLFDEYCDKIGLKTDDIRIVDASGVSKNNLVNADFITEFLLKNKDNKTLNKLCEPGVGTLSSRMIPLKNSLKAKTGTLSDISSIAGFLTTKKGKNYAFCIMINDPSTSSSDKKIVENYLIRNIYMNF